MSKRQCTNCLGEVGEEERVCSSCGYTHWYVSEYCENKYTSIGSIATHEINCEKKPPEKGMFDY